MSGLEKRLLAHMKNEKAAKYIDLIFLTKFIDDNMSEITSALNALVSSGEIVFVNGVYKLLD